MYHIVKEVHVKKKPLWLVDLLFQITPSLYREIGTKEDIEKRFDNILTLMLGAKLDGIMVNPCYQGFSISAIQIIVLLSGATVDSYPLF